MPSCRHMRVYVAEYDFGVDPETGYSDSGVRVTCSECGEVFTGNEYAREIESISAADAELRSDMRRILPVDRAFTAFEALNEAERQQFSAMVAGYMRGKGGVAAAETAPVKRRERKAAAPPQIRFTPDDQSAPF